MLWILKSVKNFMWNFRYDSFLVPQYIDEGKQHLVIGVGCTGGRHRSVTITNLIAEDLSNKGYRVVKKHRDSMLR